jgi:hypothetical protein
MQRHPFINRSGARWRDSAPPSSIRAASIRALSAGWKGSRCPPGATCANAAGTDACARGGGRRVSRDREVDNDDDGDVEVK